MDRKPFHIFVLERQPDGVAEDGVPEERWAIIKWPVTSLDQLDRLRRACGGRHVGALREIGHCTIEDQVFSALDGGLTRD